MKALKLLKKYGYLINQYTMDLVSNDIHKAIAELEELENRSCNNCKNASFEIKFGELEFNACFLVSNGDVCKWELK